MEDRTAILEASEIMLMMLGYLPDEPGDSRIIRERIAEWLALDVVRELMP